MIKKITMSRKMIRPIGNRRRFRSRSSLRVLPVPLYSPRTACIIAVTPAFNPPA